MTTPPRIIARIIDALSKLGFTHSTETAGDGYWIDVYHPRLMLGVSYFPSEDGTPVWRVGVGAGATLTAAAREAMLEQAKVAAFDLTHSVGPDLIRAASAHANKLNTIREIIGLEAAI